MTTANAEAPASTEKKTSTPRPINAESLRIAAISEKAFKFEGSVGTPTETLYDDCLPEDLTREVCDRVSEHNSNFAVGAALGFGRAAVARMAEDKEPERLTTSIPMAGRDREDVAVARKRVTVNHLTGNGDQVTTHGAMTVSVTVGGSSTGSGDMRKAMLEVRAKGSELLAG